MGVLRLMGTILRHPATKDALMENVPVVECLLIDYNANIHYVLQKTITELNEILYYTHHNGNQNKLFNPNIIADPNDYNMNLEIDKEDIEDLIGMYNDEYQLGEIYSEISRNLTQEKVVDIIFMETIRYTRTLICSLNKGWIKKVYIALDGTPSMAKIKEQKNRRYIGFHMNNIKDEIMRKYKFKDVNILQLDVFFYRSMICTGTLFMDRIQQALFHLDIGFDIDVSTLNIKGEGEKKIIHALDDYSEYQSYCIMSPDSDMLILIALLTNNSKFAGKKFYNFRIDYQKKNQYQFFDLRQLIDNFQKYFSAKIGKKIDSGKMLDLFFMLVVFGNDFLPKLEPLDVTLHFDYVCEICLNLSSSGLQFIENGKINYKYLLEFFININKNITNMAIEQSLGDKYNNYQKLCKQLSLNENDLKNNYHNYQLKPIKVTYTNFSRQMKIISLAYSKLIHFIESYNVKKENIPNLFKDIHSNPNDSYLLLIMPRLLRFPGSSDELSLYDFFSKFIEYIIGGGDFKNVKFRTRLMPKEFNLRPTPKQQGTFSAYMMEMEKLNRSMEPYRSIFRVNNIKLVSYDLENNKIIDMRDKYYDTYIKPNMAKKEIEKLVVDYLVGIEWLFRYYINCDRMEWSGWYYNNTQPPLIDDIIAYLTTNQPFHEIFENELKSYRENTMSPTEHYLHVTPNEFTNAGVSPNLSDVLHLIDGNGVLYLNKCQIKWHEY